MKRQRNERRREVNACQYRIVMGKIFREKADKKGESENFGMIRNYCR